MKERLSTGRTGPISKVFDYYKQIEEYPERYPKYCIRIDVLEKKENFLITSEMWNAVLGDLEYMKIKVKYIFTPYTEIKFEILDGYGKGNVNGIILNEALKNNVGARLAWTPLEAIELMYGENEPTLTTMAQYFNRRDVEIYEGRQVETKSGDPCPSCKVGKIFPTGKYEKTTKENESHSDRKFKCDKCGEIITHHEIGIQDKINIKDSVNVKES